MNNSSAIRAHKQHTPKLADRVFVDPSAVVIGDVEIGEDSSVWPLTVIRGDMHRIRIGARTSIQDGSILHITHAGPFNPDGYPLTVGSDVTVGHSVTLHGCTIGDRVLVGMGSMVMDGAVVENNVVIGAGSLVPPGKVLASGFLYMGSPAKQVRELKEKEMNFFTYTAGNYVKLKEQKTGNINNHPISETAFKILKLQKTDNGLVFQDIKYSQVPRRLKKWIEDAGITKKISFHNFRHSYATLQLANGTDIYTVSKLLGHKNVSTTQIYTKVMDKNKIEAANRINVKLDGLS